MVTIITTRMTGGRNERGPAREMMMMMMMMMATMILSRNKQGPVHKMMAMMMMMIMVMEMVVHLCLREYSCKGYLKECAQ